MRRSPGDRYTQLRRDQRARQGIDRYSLGPHGRPHRSRRRRQIDAIGPCGRRAQDPDWQRACCLAATWQQAGTAPTSVPVSPTCRRASAAISTRTLSVTENVDFFGRLFGQSAAERAWRIADLLHSTGLDPFADRPAGKLSGGMKQKLSLCCSLIHDPDLLIPG